MYRVVKFDLADPQKGMQDFIPEDKDAHLETISAVDNDKFVVVYKRNVSVYSISTYSDTSLDHQITGNRRALHLLVYRETGGASGR
jgi:hypothetical protein